MKRSTKANPCKLIPSGKSRYRTSDVLGLHFSGNRVNRDLTVLLDEFDFSRLPGLLKPRLKRAVESQNYPPCFSRDGLHPIARLPCRCSGSEIYVIRTVSTLLDVPTLAPKTGKLSVGLQFRARLSVVNHDGPKRLGWNVRR